MREIPLLKVRNARQLLLNGLRDKLGDRAFWLPEYEKIAEWLTDNSRKGLLLSGERGNGKTLVCTEILPKIFMDYGLNLSIQTPFTIGPNIKALTGSDTGMPCYCPVMFDDVGLETPYTEYGNTVDPFVQLVYYAEKNGQLLVLTTNYGMDWFGERYGLRVTDRLRYLVKTVEFKSTSFRR